MSETYFVFPLCPPPHQRPYAVSRGGDPHCKHRLIAVPVRDRIVVSGTLVSAAYVCALCNRMLLQVLGTIVPPATWATTEPEA